MIACKTIIGFGSPNKEGTSGVHGAPLGEEEIAAAREKLGWEHAPFDIPCEIRDYWRLAGLRWAKTRSEWEDTLAKLDPELKGEFERTQKGDLPAALTTTIQDYKKALAEDAPTLATRKASQNALEVINAVVPETISGSADLTGSNNTRTNDMKAISADDFSGRFIHYGIREHGMAAAMNGMALHKGVIPYSGTFLVFSDYNRPAIRLGALMGQRVIHVMTHDSIGLGEDGPTHQPVEHMASLRAIPNLLTFRPCDATETAECWEASLQNSEGPSLIALTRQNLKAQRTEYVEDNLCAKGAYEISPASTDAKVTLFASGSEVELAVEAQEELESQKIPTRVVSVPSFELFEMQPKECQEQIIGTAPVKIAVEAGLRMGWDRFIGSEGIFIGMSGFGASAPYKELYEHFGITRDAIVEAAKSAL